MDPPIPEVLFERISEGNRRIGIMSPIKNNGSIRFFMQDLPSTGLGNALELSPGATQHVVGARGRHPSHEALAPPLDACRL